MAVYDDSHISGRLTTAEVAESIRHKKYGVDVREAMAQGFENMVDPQAFYELQQTVTLLQQGMGDMQGKVITLESKVKNLEIDNQQLKQAVYGTGSTGIPIEQDEFDEELKSAKEINIDYGNDE